MSSYPITYSQSPPAERNRLTVFFRPIIVIPHLIWAFFYGIAAFFALVGAWFAILFTGRYPRGIYDFVAGYLRFMGRLNAYMYLVVDEFPPFDGGAHPEYPVQIEIGPPAPAYSRLKAFFRLVLAIPIFILQWAFSYWLLGVAIAIWFVAVFTGRTELALAAAHRFPMSYYVRSTAYLFLLTDVYPAVSDTPYATGAPVVPA